MSNEWIKVKIKQNKKKWNELTKHGLWPCLAQPPPVSLFLSSRYSWFLASIFSRKSHPMGLLLLAFALQLYLPYCAKQNSAESMPTVTERHKNLSGWRGGLIGMHIFILGRSLGVSALQTLQCVLQLWSSQGRATKPNPFFTVVQICLVVSAILWSLVFLLKFCVAQVFKLEVRAIENFGTAWIPISRGLVSDL